MAPIPDHEPPSVSPTLASTSSSHTHPSPPLPSPETARQVAEARAALEASMTNIGNQHFSALQSRAQNLHANTAQLDKQQKDVIKATEGLKKETEKLRKWADEGQRMVKEARMGVGLYTADTATPSDWSSYQSGWLHPSP